MKRLLFVLGVAVSLSSCATLPKGFKSSCPANNCYKIAVTTPDKKEYKIYYEDSTGQMQRWIRKIEKVAE